MTDTPSIYPMSPVRRTTGSAEAFVYSIQFEGRYPIGSVAIVVALTPEQALKAFKNKLFMHSHALYIQNFEPLKRTDRLLETSDVTVFCAASNDSLGRVQILLDGNY